MADVKKVEDEIPPMTPNEFMDTLIQRCFQDDPIFPVIDAGDPGIIVGGPKENPQGFYLLKVRKISQARWQSLFEAGSQ